MTTFDEFYASLDADSNVRGDRFEKKQLRILEVIQKSKVYRTYAN